ncbi:MAG TPA: TraR/DksA C4-type zinc finger protein [bacterium]|nr:TraR/DksA C4-type zinc finger protein [bacterium]
MASGRSAKKPARAAASRTAVKAAKAGARPAPAAPPEPPKPIVRARGLSGPRLEPYMRRLMDERRRLRQELTEMEQHQVKTEEKPVADVSGSYDDDLVDVATETFEREKGMALESSVQGMLQMVEDALRRGRSGTYGVCDGCGRLIDANRLRVIPYARLCIKCKEREERLRSAMR